MPNVLAGWSAEHLQMTSVHSQSSPGQGVEILFIRAISLPVLKISHNYAANEPSYCSWSCSSPSIAWSWVPLLKSQIRLCKFLLMLIIQGSWPFFFRLDWIVWDSWTLFQYWATTLFRCSQSASLEQSEGWGLKNPHSWPCFQVFSTFLGPSKHFCDIPQRLYNHFHHAHAPGQHMWSTKGPGPYSKCYKTLEVRCSC